MLVAFVAKKVAINLVCQRNNKKMMNCYFSGTLRGIPKISRKYEGVFLHVFLILDEKLDSLHFLLSFHDDTAAELLHSEDHKTSEKNSL
jgi:hypothetical protein